MVANPKWTPELVPAFPTGMDSGNDPDIIPQTSAALLRNVSLRGGRAKSRPRFVKRSTLPSGKIQGAFGFAGRGVLLASIDGRVHEINPNSWARVEKTSDGDRNNPNRPRHYFCETVGSVVIQDDQSQPIIYDGDRFRRAEEDEVPVGAMMAFSNGRLAVAVSNRRAVRIGDIRQDEHQSELKFTETYSLLGGGDFAFPARVNSLTSLPVVDTSTGQGSLIVGCRGRIFSLKTQVTSRDLWADVGFGSDVFGSTGIVGPRAAVAVNQDLVFRAEDGLRTLRTTVSDYESYGLVPISREVSHRLDHDGLLEDTQVALFDNRVLVTHSPIVYGNRSIALGLVSHNLDSISRAGAKSPPIYDGEWDGVQVAELVVAKFGDRSRAFIFGRDPADGTNGVWEILPESSDDAGGDSPTQEIVTRRMVGAGLDAFKTLRRLDVALSRLSGALNLKVYFRPDDHPFWVKWDEFNVSASSPGGWATPRPGHVRLATRSVPEPFDARTQRYLHQGHGFQVRVVWTGRAKVDSMTLYTEVTPAPAVAQNPENAVAVLPTVAPAGQESPAFWFRYGVKPHP